MGLNVNAANEAQDLHPEAARAAAIVGAVAEAGRAAGALRVRYSATDSDGCPVEVELELSGAGPRDLDRACAAHLERHRREGGEGAPAPTSSSSPTPGTDTPVEALDDALRKVLGGPDPEACRCGCPPYAHNDHGLCTDCGASAEVCMAEREAPPAAP